MRTLKCASQIYSPSLRTPFSSQSMCTPFHHSLTFRRLLSCCLTWGTPTRVEPAHRITSKPDVLWYIESPASTKRENGPSWSLGTTLGLCSWRVFPEGSVVVNGTWRVAHELLHIDIWNIQTWCEIERWKRSIFCASHVRKSTFAVSCVIIGAYVARDSSCALAARFPDIISRNKDTSKSPPSCPKSPRSSENFAPEGTSWEIVIDLTKRGRTILTIVFCAQTSPTSAPRRLSFISRMLTPDFTLPSIKVCCIGAGPRYKGIKDGCTFNLRDSRNKCSIRFGISLPKEAVTTRLLLGFSPFPSDRLLSLLNGGGG